MYVADTQDIFFFNDPATTEIYPLSLHDALPIFGSGAYKAADKKEGTPAVPDENADVRKDLRRHRSEEHTSELQSQSNLVCRLLLEKKKQEAIKTLLGTLTLRSTMTIPLIHTTLN